MARVVEIGNFGLYRVIEGVDVAGCVDPRDSVDLCYPSERGHIKREEHQEGAIKFPGASLGLVMTLLAAVPEVSGTRAVILTKYFEQKNGRRFVLHEAEHCKKGKLGCGHFDNAMENCEQYGLDRRRLGEAIKFIQSSGAADENDLEYSVPMVTGVHNEKGVLVVNSRQYTIAQKPTVVDSAIQADGDLFRYDKTRHLSLLMDFAVYLQSHDVEVTYEELLEVSNRHMVVSLGVLAEGLPIFIAHITDNNAVVKAKGFVSRAVAFS